MALVGRTNYRDRILGAIGLGQTVVGWMWTRISVHVSSSIQSLPSFQKSRKDYSKVTWSVICKRSEGNSLMWHVLLVCGNGKLQKVSWFWYFQKNASNLGSFAHWFIYGVCLENFLNVDQCGVKGKRRDQALQVLAHW